MVCLTKFPLPAISIHAPREGSDIVDQGGNRIVNISIHAPREGSDNWVRNHLFPDLEFQSTLPVRGATFGNALAQYTEVISIHAPRRNKSNFNPRSP